MSGTIFINNFKGIDTFRKVFTRNFVMRLYSKCLYSKRLYLMSLICLIAFSIGSYSLAENVPTYPPAINGEYSGTLYVYGVPVSVIMSISSNRFGIGHKFTLRGAQEDLFIIGGNCDCLDSGAVLAEHGLFSECLGIDMGLMDQVELDGWFTDTGYSGELKLFAAGSDISIPSLTGIFDLVRQ